MNKEQIESYFAATRGIEDGHGNSLDDIAQQIRDLAMRALAADGGMAEDPEKIRHMRTQNLAYIESRYSPFMGSYVSESLRYIDALRQRVAGLEAERNEARAFAEQAAARYNELLAEKRVLRCAFCDAAYPDGTPATQHEALTAHVMVCPKHPLRAENERLRQERWPEVADWPELKLPGPRSEPEALVVWINQALRDGIERAFAVMQKRLCLLERNHVGDEMWEKIKSMPLYSKALKAAHLASQAGERSGE